MAAFKYLAEDSSGQARRGVIEADTSRQARQQLRAQGLLTLEMSAVEADFSASGSNAGRRRSGRRLPAAQLTLLTRQWATLLDAGLPLEQTLNALIEQSEYETARHLLAGVRSEVMAGHSLAQSLEPFGSVFFPLYRALIAAGEKSGQLAEVMSRLADYLETREQTRQRVTQAMIYPAMIVLVAVLVVGGLMTYVVPQVIAVFQNGKQTLPLLTRLLMGTSDFLRLFGIPLLLAGAGAIWGIGRSLHDPARRLRFHGLLLRLPVLGGLLRTLDSARFAQTLAILVGSGAPLLVALQAGQAVLFLLPLQAAVEAAEARVREGWSLARALAQAKCFPPLLIHLIASGESSGRLPALLDKAAAQQQSEVDGKIALGISILEPLLILGMGVLVLGIVLAILQPIIEINQLLR